MFNSTAGSKPNTGDSARYHSSLFWQMGSIRFDQIFSRANTLQIMVKAKDELGGRLTDKGGIRKVLDKNEKQKLARGYGRAKEILKNTRVRLGLLEGKLI